MGRRGWGVRLLASARVTALAPRPTLRLERKCWKAGERLVCGIDEVGRGAWAGPVTVAAVIPAPEHLRGVRDSKMLTPGQREVAAASVRGWAVAIGIGHASHEECDLLGMTAAQRVAGRRALGQLAAQGYEPDRVILDGNHDYLQLGARCTTVIKGDATSLAVAAASIVAKVTRRRDDGRRGRALPGVRIRVEPGLPGAGAQGRAGSMGPNDDPPALVGVHGRVVLGRTGAGAGAVVLRR